MSWSVSSYREEKFNHGPHIGSYLGVRINLGVKLCYTNIKYGLQMIDEHMPNKILTKNQPVGNDCHIEIEATMFVEFEDTPTRS